MNTVIVHLSDGLTESVPGVLRVLVNDFGLTLFGEHGFIASFAPGQWLNVVKVAATNPPKPPGWEFLMERARAVNASMEQRLLAEHNQGYDQGFARGKAATYAAIGLTELAVGAMAASHDQVGLQIQRLFKEVQGTDGDRITFPDAEPVPAGHQRVI